jgi:hypothetical protein
LNFSIKKNENTRYSRDKENKIIEFNKLNEQSVDNIKDATKKIVEYIDVLEKADTSGLSEDKKDKYFKIISKYKKILFKLCDYICTQKPIYKTLLKIIEKYDESNNNDEKEKLTKSYKQICNKIDVNTSTEILDMVIKLQEEIDLELFKIRDQIKKDLYLILKKGLITLGVIIGSIAFAYMFVCVTATTFVTISLISSTAVLTFIKLDGLKLLKNICSNVFQYKMLSEVDQNLNILKNHLNNIREQAMKLKDEVFTFQICQDIDLYNPNEKENIKIINNIINKFDEMENIINNGLKK